MREIVRKRSTVDFAQTTPSAEPMVASTVLPCMYSLRDSFHCIHIAIFFGR